MLIKSFLYLLAILLTAMIACSNTDEPVIDEDLLDVVWRVDSLQTPEENIVPTAAEHLTIQFSERLQFDEDYKVLARTTCNTYWGTYEINEDGSLSIVFLTWTEIVCAERRAFLEGKFISTLIKITDYEVTENQSTLSNGARQYVVHLSSE